MSERNNYSYWDNNMYQQLKRHSFVGKKTASERRRDQPNQTSDMLESMSTSLLVERMESSLSPSPGGPLLSETLL